MSNWISLSSQSSRRNVVQTSRHGYTIFEVPMEQEVAFQLSVDKVTTLQSRKHMVYFVAQGTETFGEESWSEWKSGPASMSLHEYFNRLNGGSNDYSPATVRQIGANYITAFEITENGQVNWGRLKSILYEPKRAGEGIWLECLYYYPDWGNMGVFIIGVEEPQVYCCYARVRDYENYDPDREFVMGITHKVQGVRYGDIIDMDIETHRIIPGRYTAEIEILHQGTRVYNGKKRLELDKYAFPNNPALEYNLEVMESLFVDPAWGQAIGHQDGTTQTYTLRLTFNPKNVLENRRVLDGSNAPGTPVVQEFEIEVTTAALDPEVPRPDTTPQIIGIQEETLTPIEHEECRYSVLKVIVDGETLEILKEDMEQGVLEVNKINPIIEIVAGNHDAAKTIEISLENVNIEECENDPSHEDNVFDLEEVPSREELIKRTAFSRLFGGEYFEQAELVSEVSATERNLIFKVAYPYNAINLHSFLLKYLSFRLNPVEFPIKVQTCRYTRIPMFRVYPDTLFAIHLNYDPETVLYFNNEQVELLELKANAFDYLQDLVAWLYEPFKVVFDYFDKAVDVIEKIKDYFGIENQERISFHNDIQKLIEGYISKDQPYLKTGFHMKADGNIINYADMQPYKAYIYYQMFNASLVPVLIELLLLYLTRGKSVSPKLKKAAETINDIRDWARKIGDEFNLELIYPKVSVNYGTFIEQQPGGQMAHIMQYTLQTRPLLGIRTTQEFERDIPVVGKVRFEAVIDGELQHDINIGYNSYTGELFLNPNADDQTGKSGKPLQNGEVIKSEMNIGCKIDFAFGNEIEKNIFKFIPVKVDYSLEAEFYGYIGVERTVGYSSEHGIFVQDHYYFSGVKGEYLWEAEASVFELSVFSNKNEEEPKWKKVTLIEPFKWSGERNYLLAPYKRLAERFKNQNTNEATQPNPKDFEVPTVEFNFTDDE